MGTRAVERGAVAVAVATNIRAVRERRGWTQQQLARRMSELGRPLAASAVAKVESGDRRVDVDDFAAFATALNVSPARLMIVDSDDSSAPCTITPTYQVQTSTAWRWAEGKGPLYATDELSWEVDLRRRRLEFMAERPVWLRVLDEEPVMKAFRRLEEHVASIAGFLARQAGREQEDRVVHLRSDDNKIQERISSAKFMLPLIEGELEQLVNEAPAPTLRTSGVEEWLEQMPEEEH